MFLVSRRNIIVLILSIIIAVGFLWAVLTPPSIFNFLPYAIHESMKTNAISENNFIRVFDICSSMVVFVLSYILSRNAFSVYGLFK